LFSRNRKPFGRATDFSKFKTQRPASEKRRGPHFSPFKFFKMHKQIMRLKQPPADGAGFIRGDYSVVMADQFPTLRVVEVTGDGNVRPTTVCFYLPTVLAQNAPRGEQKECNELIERSRQTMLLMAEAQTMLALLSKAYAGYINNAETKPEHSFTMREIRGILNRFLPNGEEL
jgi:hypothetical protein